MKNIEALRPWIKFFKRILKFNDTESSEQILHGGEIQQQNKNIYWKLKAKAAKTIFHLISGSGWSEMVIDSL